MSAQTQLEPAFVAQSAPPWSLTRRIAFRFCLIYFTLFCLSNQILASIFPIPEVDQPDLATLWPVRQLVLWTAHHIFRVKTELVYQGSGSGDKTFDWVLTFCLLVLAAIATALWSVLDRKRSSYRVLARWSHLLLRIAVASQMFIYGFAKAPPLQMPFPNLAHRVEIFGNQSPMGILWSSIGASPGYEIFGGCAELLGGLLLIFPRTFTLGALICLADMTEVFALNMTFDVPVKLFSFHMILMSLLLLAPQARRLANFFALNRPAQPSPSLALFSTRRARRITTAVLAFLWLWMIGMNIYGAWTSWHEYGGGRTKPVLFGIWDIEQLTRDGQLQPPLLTDQSRWRRAIFDVPNFMQFERLDDSFAGFSAAIDDKKNTMTLTKSGDKTWKATFVFTRTAPDRLSLQGAMEGHEITMELHRLDETKFLFASRGFHWIQEYPLDR
jgi:uncharacterized membrane protein YphA (DoxX/SURF4 family)